MRFRKIRDRAGIKRHPRRNRGSNFALLENENLSKNAFMYFCVSFCIINKIQIYKHSPVCYG